ncbi:eukaryotic translation initiation factor 3 subunit A [Trichonephila inaurata madagascariensis]|uniref:Eukaryotic translation initiation factor 3 subunit A n=1 Tax=Trichonephila inaurata madagascariensis TaxID=2747483 RepID=A0A8X7C029_9ARAC|nr:eukaryotic translation initiation factor 3 subunit A [Trichonephila inaurata madagascariensis]
MSNLCYNPENALKRANALLELGKQDEAIDCLYDALKNRKNRMFKHIHESIINKLLEMCVERRFSGLAKDGLYLYRIICQSVNVKSWEDAVKNLLFLAENKIESCLKELQMPLTSFNSLDRTLTPESLMKLSNSEEVDINFNQIILLTWIKFMWECYRICLELLRNSQMEKIYHYIVHRAFKFCLKYCRKTDFRKLCNLLRLHIGYLQKRYSELFSNICDSEVNVLYLETGILELDTALELELWPEAFKAAEDIHLLINFAKKSNSKAVAIYYEKLSLVFWKANDLLYHAAALFRFFQLSRDVKKNFSYEISALSSRVVLAVLSTPFAANNPIIDLVVENDLSLIGKKYRLLSSLLNFPNKPTRKALIKEIKRYNILQTSPPEIQNLFHMLENEVDPLNMSTKLLHFTNVLDEIGSPVALNQYLTPLFIVSTIRLLSQLSKIYETITLNKLMSLVPFEDQCFVERLIIESARRYDIPVRIDHIHQCLRFNCGLSLFQNKNVLDGPETDQLPESESINYLSQLHLSLNKINQYIKPDYFKLKNNATLIKLKEQYLLEQNVDRKRILERKKMIERHKEMLESIRLKKQEEERKMIIEKQLKHEAAERERLLKEAKERAYQKQVLQEEEIKRQIFQEKMESLKRSELGQLIEKLELDELTQVDPESLLTKHIELVKREKKEFLRRLRKQEKTIFHMERAKRMEEIPLLKLEYEKEKVEIHERWEHDEKRRIQKFCEERSHMQQNRNRMLAMKDDLAEFIKKVKERTRSEHAQKLESFFQDLQKEREKRLLERAMQRKTQRRNAWIEDQNLQFKKKKEPKRFNRNQEAANSSKTTRENSPTKFSRHEYTQESQSKLNRSLFYIEHQNRLYKSNSKNETKSSTKYTNIRTSAFNNQPMKGYNLQKPVFRKNRDSSTQNIQPRYQILKRDEIPSGRTSKEFSVSSWQKRTDSSSDIVDFNKSNCDYSRFPSTLTKQSTITDCCPEETTEKSISKQNSKGLDSQEYFEPESSKNKGLSSDLSISQKESKFEHHSTDRTSNNEYDESHQINSVKKQKYDIRRSCTPWAKLSRKDNTNDRT